MWGSAYARLAAPAHGCGITANGTLILKAQVGRFRAQPGDMIIEQNGAIRVRTIEETAEFVESLKRSASLEITNIGPGKARQFGTAARAKRKRNRIDRRATERIQQPPRYLPVAGAMPSIECVPVEALPIDYSCQRNPDSVPSSRLIIHIASKFDWRLCTPFVVSRRSDGTRLIIDGQCRWLAARRRGDIPQLPCCLFQYENSQEEARMFIRANRSRRPISRLDDYFAVLAAGDEDAIEIQQIVTDAGLRVTRKTLAGGPPAGEIAFTASIANAVRKVGAEIASAALTDMAVAFRGQKLDHGAAIFGALVKILVAPEPGFDPDLLMSALQTRTVEQWGGLVTGLDGKDARTAVLRTAFMKHTASKPSALRRSNV